MSWFVYFVIILVLIVLLIVFLFVHFKLQNKRAFPSSDSLPKLRPGSGSPALYKMDKMLKENDIVNGVLFFEAPFQMRTGNKYRIVSGVARSQKILIKERGTEHTYDIPVTDLMGCKLSGETFTITAINNETQAVLSKEVTSWEWNVVPQKAGIQNLLLLVSIYIKTGSENTLKDIPVFEQPVTVEINAKYHVRQFFIKNWQWLAGTIVGSGLVWEILKLKLKQ